MKKNFLPIFISAIIAFSLVGCGGGSGSSSSGDTGFYYYNAQTNPDNSSTNNNNNNNNNNSNESSDNTDPYAIKTIYKTSEGYIPDLCQIPGTCQIAFPICSEKNGKILMCKNGFEENQEIEELASNLIKPFSIQCVKSGRSFCFTTIEPEGGKICSVPLDDLQDFDDNGNRIVKTYITSNVKTLKSPRYIVTPDLIDICGVDFSPESSFVYSATRQADQETGEYQPSGKSVVIPNAKFFNLLVYDNKYIVTGSLSAEGGIAVFEKNTNKEIIETTDEIKIKSGQTTGKYITGISYDKDGIVYSSFQDPNKLAIYKYNPDGEDKLLCSSDEIPAAYEIVRGYINFQDKFIFTSCGSNGNQGIYIVNFDGTGLQRIIAPTKEAPMLNPSKIIMDQKYSKNVIYSPLTNDGALWWTCCGGTFDREKGEFTGSEGIVHFKQFSGAEFEELMK